MKFIYTIVVFLFVLPLFGQSDCTIKVANEVSEDIIVRSGALYSQSEDNSQWTINSNNVSMELGPGELSSLLTVDRFNIDIPEGSELQGVSIIIRGRADGGNLFDDIINYITSTGESINVANNLSQGSNWPATTKSWRYGDTYDLLGGPLTVDNLRSDDFSVNIQLQNNGGAPSNIVIEDVRILVRYRAPYTICPDHLCVIFFMDDVQTSSQYNWMVPDGFELLDNQNGTGIVGIIVQDTTANGLYEICVDEVSPNGSQGQCCRQFVLGDCQPNSVGDAVFVDHNQNGIFDSEEEGIPSVTVNLVDDENNLLATTQTDVNGNYRFGNLDDGFYQIEVDYDGNFVPSFTSSFSEFMNGLRSDIFYLSGSSNIDTFDFGFIAEFDITGIVWTDSNCNGILEDGEPLISSWPVVLFDGDDNLIGTTLSGVDGTYEFKELESDTYSVWLSGFDNAVFEPTLVVEGDLGNSLTILNGSAMTIPFLLESNTIKNLGITAITGSISGNTFIDNNGDNSSLNDEILSGVEVSLFSCLGDFIQTLQTDDQGSYAFTKVPVGEYYIEFGTSENYITQDSETTLESGNNDITSEFGLNTTDCFAVIANGDSSISAGYFESVSIGDYVWFDLNEDGLQDANEPGVNGVTIQLYKSDGSLIAETITANSTDLGSDGFYTFDLLTPGDYYLQALSIGSDYTQVNPSNDTINSDITEGNGQGTTETFTSLSGAIVSDIDVGLVFNSGAINGNVFDDVSGNGYFEDEDFGLDSIIVNAIGQLGIVFTTLTDQDGNYTLTNLPNDVYTVTLDLEDSYNLTESNVTTSESNDTNDSDFELINNIPTVTVEISFGQIVENIDGGFFKYGTISGLVWIDENLNGIREDNELLTNDYTVILRGDVADQVLTLTDGMYTASNLRPGTYNIMIENNGTLIFSPAKIGNDATLDSDIELMTNVGSSTKNIFIESGTVVSNVDAGLVVDPNAPTFGTLTGTLFEDNYADGVSINDLGIGGIEVMLLDSDDSVIQTQLTAADGSYFFDNLDFGNYTLQINTNSFNTSTANVGTDDSIDSDFTTTDMIAEISTFINGFNAIQTYDLGLYRLGEISGIVWFDFNGDGLRGEDDLLLSGYVVSLNSTAGSTEMVTDDNGMYHFANLLPDIYNISTTVEGDGKFTLAQVGSDNTLDSDIVNINGTDGTTTNLFINSGNVVGHIDLGITPLDSEIYSVSGTVFTDVTADGLQSDGDEGEEGVDLILFDSAENVIASTVTDNTGNYNFDSLVEGSYIIRMITTRELSPTNVGANDLVDSDFGIVSNLYQVDFTLSANQTDLDFDAGLFGLGEISGRVWEDSNKDGIRGSEDSALVGEEVNLLNSNQEVVATVVTTEEGYFFGSVVPGLYSVQYLLKDNFKFTQVYIGSDTSLDSDILNINENVGTTSNQFIFSDTVKEHVDIGLINNNANGSISGLIFEDLFANNIQDGDPGIQFISVNLVNDQGVIFDTQLTNELGQYLFTEIPLGTYTVQYQLPEIYNLSEIGIGNNEDIDVDFSLIGDMATSETITVSQDMDVTNVDSGMWRFINISGLIWNDLNEDGLRGVDEPIITDQPVSLINLETLEIVSTVTSEGTGYEFDLIPPGFYFVSLSLSNNFILTAMNVGSDDTIDSEFQNTIGTLVTTNNLFVESGDSRGGLDAGLIEQIETPIAATVQGTIFEDLDFDGIQNGDIGVEGVMLNLINATTGAAVATVSSSTSGDYTFLDVSAGDYYVELELPIDYLLTQPDLGMDDAIDSDFALDGNANVFSELFTIDTQGMLVDHDAGIFKSGSISGLVWLDENEDGIRNLDDGSLVGIEILLMQNGTIVQSEISTNTGYRFDNLTPGLYTIGTELNTTLYTTTAGLQGSDPTIDSDIINTGSAIISTGEYSVQSDQTIMNIDIGVIGLEVNLTSVSINTQIFEDINGDGVNIENTPYTADEIMVTVVSKTTGMVFFMEVMTEVSDFTIDNLELIADTYELSISSFAGLTLQNVGSNEERDSDFSESMNGTYKAEFIVEEVTTEIDFTLGVYDFVTISGRAWNDEDMNGIQEDGELNEEAGVANVVVILNNGVGMATATSTTDENGEYQFEGIPPDNYRIGTLIPEGTEYTADDVSSDDIDSDIILFSGINGSSALFTMQSGDSLTTLDIGLFGDISENMSSTVTGFVWEDRNGDGQLDLTEQLMNGVNVSLYLSDGTLVDQIETMNSPDDVSGYYTFNVINPGDYYVQFASLASTVVTESFAASTEFLDSDVTESNGVTTTDIISVLSGEEYAGVNYGYYFEGFIGDYVWNDENHNGIQDQNEAGIDGVEITLVDKNGVIHEIVESSDANGRPGTFTFSGVRPGIYNLRVNPPTHLEVTQVGVGGNDAFDSNINPNTNSTSLFAIVSGELNMNLDIGLYTPGVGTTSLLGDQVFIDLNGNNVQDSSDPGLNNVQVDLFTEDGTLVQTTITETRNGIDGKYGFNEVSTGKYYIVFTPSDEVYRFVRPNQGNSDGLDSDVTSEIAPGSTNIFTVASGIQELDIDAGIYLPASIGNYVWEDGNQNGIQEVSEAGFANVEVELYRSSGVFLTSMISDANGGYRFDDIQPGDYFIRFKLSGGVAITTQIVGGDMTLNNDSNQSGLTATFTIDHGISNFDIDAGVYQTHALIAGRAWFDENENGSQDFNEIGFEEIRVELLDDDGNFIKHVFTDKLGNYTFVDLDENRYIIRFVEPMGYEFSESQFFIGDEEDSDVNENGMTAILNMTTNPIQYFVDAGLMLSNLLVSKSDWSLNVYPNPAVETVMVSVESDGSIDSDAIITIYDQLARQVMVQSVDLNINSDARLDVSHLRSGIYQVYIDSNGRLSHQQLIIID